MKLEGKVVLVTGAFMVNLPGPVPMDLIMNKGKGFLARCFSGARNGADIARDLAKRPRPPMFSTFMERSAGFVANIAAIRIPVVKRMAATARKNWEYNDV
jgi:hypothetical protein